MKIAPCWLLRHVILYLFVIKWLHIRKVSSREFRCCGSLKSLQNFCLSYMKWLGFPTRHVRNEWQDTWHHHLKWERLKLSFYLFQQKAVKAYGRVVPCLLVFLRRKLVSHLVRSTLEANIESVWTIRCRKNFP